MNEQNWCHFFRKQKKKMQMQKRSQAYVCVDYYSWVRHTAGPTNKLIEFYLNNKGRLDGDICYLFVYLCVCLSGLDLRNGATYEYEICTANSCDDALKDDLLIFTYFNFSRKKLGFTKKQSLLYISKTVNRTNVKF